MTPKQKNKTRRQIAARIQRELRKRGFVVGRIIESDRSEALYIYARPRGAKKGGPEEIKIRLAEHSTLTCGGGTNHAGYRLPDVEFVAPTGRLHEMGGECVEFVLDAVARIQDGNPNWFWLRHTHFDGYQYCELNISSTFKEDYIRTYRK